VAIFQSSRPRILIACLFLVLATLAVYWPVRHYGFVEYDDNDYVYENPVVRAGLTWQGVQWSLVDRQASNWHPLTWLSHMADCQFFGLNAGAHHLVSIAFHCANAVLLFLLLQTIMRPPPDGPDQRPDSFWLNLFVAALFALHPLRVESVAWISERKDVLSGFFGLLTLLCYAQHATRSKSLMIQTTPASRFTFHVSFYFLSILFFALGLLSKPVLVTLPFIMLLLDYWPLERQLSPWKPLPRHGGHGVTALPKLLAEKWPFFLLAALSCVITLLAQRTGLPAQNMGIFPRIETIAVNYLGYIEKLLWPQNLSFLYLRPDAIPVQECVMALLVLFCISALVYAGRRRCPALVTGWLWFLFMLLPVSGIVSLGRLSIADRYTYLAGIGLYLMVAWAFADIVGAWFQGWRKIVPAAAAAAILAVCALLSRQQLGYWQNTQTLMEHALQVDPGNYVAKQNLHIYLFEKAHPNLRPPPPD